MRNGNPLIGHRREEVRIRKREPMEILGAHGYAYAAIRENSLGEEFVDVRTVAESSLKAAFMAEVHDMPSCPVVRVRIVVLAEFVKG